MYIRVERQKPQEPAVEPPIKSERNPIWYDWCCEPHTEDEIREMVLTNYNDICFSFLCRYSKMSTKFIEELMVLSTGALTKENYNTMYESVHKALINKLGIEKHNNIKFDIKVPEERYSYFLSNGSKTITQDNLSDNLDFFYITMYQKLDKEFVDRFKKYVNWDNIIDFQKFDRNFLIKYKKYISINRLNDI